MGLLKTGLKLVGSAALGAAGVASTVLRTVASAAGSDELADVIGDIQNKSFETIRDMWTAEEEKTEEYFEAREERRVERAENAARLGEQKRREYEHMKEKMERE